MKTYDDDFINSMKKYIARNESFINTMDRYVDMLNHELELARELREQMYILCEARHGVDVLKDVPEQTNKSHLKLIK